MISLWGSIRSKCSKLGKQPRDTIHLIEQFQLEEDEDLESIYSLNNLSIYNFNSFHKQWKTSQKEKNA